VRASPVVRVVEHALVLDLLRTADGRAAGITLHVLGEGTRDGVGAVHARAVVLATGGMGQVFSSTTNPSVSTGDGVALALRAGAAVADLEFVQFHPTALFLGAGSTGQQPLVSEAMRGEGAFLVDPDGERVITTDDHPLADLAPRDVVAKAIHRRMRERGDDHVLLDARHLGEDLLLTRFPTIVARCREAGVDPVVEPIPVAPAAHYASGGVRTDLDGRTDVPGLYACGEVACTGVHGANRLASNSLLEGLVFAGRIGEDLARSLPPQGEPVPLDGEALLLDPSVRAELGTAMTLGRRACCAAPRPSTRPRARSRRSPAVARSSPSPARGRRPTCTPSPPRSSPPPRAARRPAGAHWREDHPDADDAWRGTSSPRCTAPRTSPWSRHDPRRRHAAALVRAGLDPAQVLDLVARAVAEDLDGGRGRHVRRDRAADLRGVAAFVPRADGTLAGLGRRHGRPRRRRARRRAAGARRRRRRGRRGGAVLEASGPVRSLLTAERTALNLLCHLSGIATLTATWVDAVAGHRCAHPRHPQDDAGPAGAREARGAVRRRRQPPHVAVGRGARQGQPRRRGRRRRRGLRRGARALPRRAGRGRVRHRSTRSARCSRRRRPGPARQHDRPTTCGRASRSAAPQACSPRRPAACRWRSPASSRDRRRLPAVGGLPTRRRCLDLGVELRTA
jgi:nicotinate-nucleotide pyrophosphorylase (carboxylating)